MKRLMQLSMILALLLPVVAIRTAHAQTGVTWLAEFYNNPDLSGTPVHSRQNTDIAFNWETGSPAPGIVNADNFSARFTSSVYLQQDNYRFAVLADDDVRLYIDGALLIDSFGRRQHGQTLTADAALGAGYHSIQVDYREAVQEAFLYVYWSTSSTAPGTIPGDNLWTAQYFANQDLAGTPAYTATEPSPTHSWGTRAPIASMPSDNWSARWTSSQNLSTGTYRIRVDADDGVRVFVDNVLFIDEWHEASGQTYQSTFNLSAGRHTFVIEFYENQGTAHLNYTLESITGPIPPPTASQTAEVTVFALRVRDQPSTLTGQTLFQIQRGQVYPVVGRSTDGNWWQINVNGTLGWVFGQYVDVTNATVLSPSSVTARVATSKLNMRASPEVSNNILTVLSRNTRVQVLGRSEAGFWLRVRVNGINGWISSRFAVLEDGVTLFELPIVS